MFQDQTKTENQPLNGTSFYKQLHHEMSYQLAYFEYNFWVNLHTLEPIIFVLIGKTSTALRKNNNNNKNTEKSE